MFYLRKQFGKKNDDKILRHTSVLKIRICTKNLHSIKKKEKGVHIWCQKGNIQDFTAR